MPGEEKTKEEIEKKLGIVNGNDLEKIDLRKSETESAPQPEKEALSEKFPETSLENKPDLKPEDLAGEGQSGEGMIVDPGAQVQNQRIKKIEAVLEEDLGDIYSKMPISKQKEFKIEGERVTKKISELLNVSKVKVKKIIDLIRGWLSIIPGVNNFFLEQETKIKTDKIIKLRGK